MAGSSGFIWSPSMPPPAPPLMLPRKPAASIQPVPVAAHNVFYDDYPVGTQQVTVTKTSRLTNDDLKQLTEDWNGNRSSDGDGDIVLIPSKPVKWRILRQQKVPSTKTASKVSNSSPIPANVIATASYASPPGNGYLAPATPPLYQPTPTLGGYYVPASATGLDVAYQPVTGYFM